MIDLLFILLTVGIIWLLLLLAWSFVAIILAIINNATDWISEKFWKGFMRVGNALSLGFFKEETDD